MDKYSIPVENFDLELTLTCGQTFCWHRTEGKLYGEGKNQFYTFRNGEPVIVSQPSPEKLEVHSNLSPENVKKALGLDHSLEEIFKEFPQDERLEKAKEQLWGLRIVQDEFFPCLISYLCSPQMQIPRIKKMHNQIAEKYGEQIEKQGYTLKRFPSLEQLSKASEKQLRELGVGYRAKYITETTEILEKTDIRPEKLENQEYKNAREQLKQLYGVGNKVADCILLFSLGHRQAYPLDTWALKTVEKHYPEMETGDYEETSENLRKHFGENAGYAQEYLFHAARNDIIKTP